MKTLNNKTVILLLASALIFAGCTKQLEIDPQQSIDAAQALTTADGVNASITGIYAKLKSARWYGRDMITHPEALADNGYATNASGRLLPESNNTSGAHFTTTIWTTGYAGINQINLAIDAVTAGIPGASAGTKNNWLGQLYFLRGLYYFDMVRVYSYIPGAVVAAQDRGGVPLVLKGFNSVDSALVFRPSRTPVNDVYDQIVKDLTAANTNLTWSTSLVNLANKAATQGLLARVNLYRKNFGEAKRWADSAIALVGSRLTTSSTFVSNWRAATHQETIFQIAYLTSAENIGVNESLQTSFTSLVTPGNPTVTGGFGDLVPSITLLNDLGITLVGGNTSANYLGVNAVVASRSDDVRNLLFEPGSSGRTGKRKIECTKFLGKNGFINLDNVPVMRVAELYLIRAECAATQGSSVFSEANAIADLKKIKSNRILNYTGSDIETADNALTGSALYEEILKQRRIEFAFEGFRFFDFKRLGRDIVKSAPNANPPVAFTDFRILPAIYQPDVDGNPNIKQNFGY